jgi:hypothetical protein
MNRNIKNRLKKDIDEIVEQKKEKVELIKKDQEKSELINSIEGLFQKNKQNAEKRWQIKIDPQIMKVNSLENIKLLNNNSSQSLLYVCEDIKIPIATKDLFFNFLEKEKIGYQLKEDFRFNEFVKAKKGDFVLINLNENRFVSDLSFVINGKEFGISSSIINFEKKILLNILSINKENLVEYIKDIDKQIL